MVIEQTRVQGISRRAWRVALGCWCIVACAQAAELTKEEKSSTLLNLTPKMPPDLDERDRHVLEFDVPAARNPFGERREISQIYFPPNPPPLGVELSLHNLDPRVGGPADLAPMVMEPFYAPLSTRLIDRSLTRKQEEHLAAYLAKNAARRRELRERLAGLVRVRGSGRLQALEEFAAQQTPLLAELEKDAERMRVECFEGSAGADWYEWRSWKLGRGSLGRGREQTLFLESQLLRAAAFYQPGLSPAQRRLLRESAMELESSVFPTTPGAGPSADEWFWFFSPHLARVHLPPELPTDVTTLIAAYREEKAAVKSELRDAIYAQDRVVFASARERALAELAQAQAAPIAALEQRAEEIRRRLALTFPLATPEPPAPLPAELEAQINDYAREKKLLERELADAVSRAIRRLLPPDTTSASGALQAWHADRMEAIEKARNRFREENADRLAAVGEKLGAIRSAIETWAGPEALASRHGSGSFLKEFFIRRDLQQSTYDYHIAVFEPGLSPEQRRLLFAAAIVAMNLPLPGPEDQPTNLPGTLLK